MSSTDETSTPRICGRPWTTREGFRAYPDARAEADKARKDGLDAKVCRRAGGTFAVKTRAKAN